MTDTQVIKRIAKRHFLSTIHNAHPKEYWPTPHSLFLSNKCRDLITVHGIVKNEAMYITKRTMQLGADNSESLALAICLVATDSTSHEFVVYQPQKHTQLLETVSHLHRGWTTRMIGSDYEVLSQMNHAEGELIATWLADQALPFGAEVTDGHLSVFTDEPLTEDSAEALLNAAVELKKHL